MARRVHFSWHGLQALGIVREGTADGLEDAATHLLIESQRLAPFESGELEESGETSSDRPRLRAAVSYKTPYAVIQHEDLDLEHDPGRKAKYLEEPLVTERPEMRRLIAAAIRRKLLG